MRKFLATGGVKRHPSPKMFGSRGFTLVELLVTIVIVSIVSSFVFTAASAAQRVARNGQRKSDMKTIQSALGQYYVDHGFYPTGGLNGTVPNPFKAIPGSSLDNCIGQPDGTCTATRTYLQSFPEDPIYKYGGDCRHYCYVAYKSSASAGSAATRNLSDCPTNAAGDQCQYYELSMTTEPNPVIAGASCVLPPPNFIQHQCDTGEHIGNFVVTPLGELTIP